MSRATLCCVLACGAITASLTVRAGEETIRLREAPGHDVVAARCAMCHSLDYVQMNAGVLDRAGWQKSVRKMIDVFGAPIGDDDAALIVEYLAGNY